MHNFARYVLIVLTAVLAFTPVSRSDEPNMAFTKQISQVLAECEKIKPGMSRADLLKIFTTEGGAVKAMRRTFVYRGCPNIKVDVEFKLTDLKQEPIERRTRVPASGSDADLKSARQPTDDWDDERSADTIITISRPYLADPIYD